MFDFLWRIKEKFFPSGDGIVPGPTLTAKITAKITKDMTEKERINFFFRNNKCPDCKEWKFLEGPSGGMATNIKCSVCGSFFNEMGPFGIERIRWIEHDVGVFDNNISFTSKVLHWEMVIVSKVENWEEVYHDCHNNTTDKWCIKSGAPNSGGTISDDSQTIFFRCSNDAVMFKVKWG